jgi:hypothetical protein
MGIAGPIEVVTPFEGHMGCRQYRVLIAVKNTVAITLRTVFGPDQPGVLLLKLFQFLVEGGFGHEYEGGEWLFQMGKPVCGDGPFFASIRQLPTNVKLGRAVFLMLLDFEIVFFPG